MKLPKGEETLPFAEVNGKFLTLNELQTQYPEVLKALLQPVSALGAVSYASQTSSELLLTERFKQRMLQGRERTIHRVDLVFPILTPEEQLKHMQAKDEIGMELLAAERKFLQEEIRLIGS